jgi:hypothetical protein
MDTELPCSCTDTGPSRTMSADQSLSTPFRCSRWNGLNALMPHHQGHQGLASRSVSEVGSTVMDTPAQLPADKGDTGAAQGESLVHSHTRTRLYHTGQGEPGASPYTRTCLFLMWTKVEA